MCPCISAEDSDRAFLVRRLLASVSRRHLEKTSPILQHQRGDGALECLEHEAFQLCGVLLLFVCDYGSAKRMILISASSRSRHTCSRSAFSVRIVESCIIY